MKFLPPLFVLLGLLAGCSTVNTLTAPKVDLAKYRRVFVESRLNDNNGIDQRIANELNRRGYTASSGPLTLMPEDTEIVVTYDARWEWDFRQYLIELRIGVRPAQNFTVLASGRYFHPGLTSKTPDAMVQELLAPLFPRR
ncbi:MAG: hypothetical protein HY302_03375 [Opitutae bacterium]|nr:hypothetical protein [Opitutae bacterium]